MAIRWAVANGNFSSTSTWNDGATLGIPNSDDDVFSNGFTVNMDVNATVISLNNTARARTIATPQMTANNAPSPFVAAASNLADATQPFQAFDRNTTSTLWAANTPLPQWLSMDFGSSVVIDGYTIFGDDQLQNPRNWTFEGSNNNTSWTTLHTVTLPSAIATNSTYSIASIGNIVGYRYYRINVTLNGTGTRLRVRELELYQPFTAAIAAGGSFNFNTAGVNVTATTITFGTVTTISFTNTTGVCTLTSVNQINFNATVNVINISMTGNGNVVINAPTISLTTSGGNSNGYNSFNKSGAGILTINGNITLTNNSSGFSTVAVLTSNNGSVIINGIINPIIGTSLMNSGGFCCVIRILGGSLTVNGNVNPPAVFFVQSALNLHAAIFFQSGSLLTINGNIISGIGTSIFSSVNTNIVGNITASSGGASVISFGSITLNVTGNTIASSTANAISMTNASAVVFLNGNMTNINGFQGVYASNLFLGSGTTTFAAFTTSGGADRTLYSPDTFPNLPSTSNVRQSIGFGPANGLTGTMIVPSPSNVRVGVLTDNTVGTGSLTPEDLFNSILSGSTNPIAVRLRNVSTVQNVGDQLASYI
jgi:hypothetical protein